MAAFRNDSGFALSIERFGRYLQAGEVFELADVDADSLAASPFFTRLDAELELEQGDVPAEPADVASEPVDVAPEDDEATVDAVPAELETAVVPAATDLDSFTQV